MLIMDVFWNKRHGSEMARDRYYQFPRESVSWIKYENEVNGSLKKRR